MTNLERMREAVERGLRQNRRFAETDLLLSHGDDLEFVDDVLASLDKGQAEYLDRELPAVVEALEHARRMLRGSGHHG